MRRRLRVLRAVLAAGVLLLAGRLSAEETLTGKDRVAVKALPGVAEPAWSVADYAPAAAAARQSLLQDTYTVIVDNENAGYYIESGTWELDRDKPAWQNYIYSIAGPGDGSARATWIADSLPPGTYDLDFFVRNGDYASDAHYEVEHATGVALVVASQYYVGDGWHPLGRFTFDGPARVTLTDYWTSGGGRVVTDAIRFTSLGAVSPPTINAVTPHISICIDDAGGSNPATVGSTIYRFLHLPCPITIAVFPHSAYTTQTIAQGLALGKEMILHQPMQYVDGSSSGDPDRLYEWMSDAQVLEVIRNNLDDCPGVVGMNNHQGSLITQNRRIMDVVCAELKARGLFFFDSRTISASVAFDSAKDAGLLAGERDEFIDSTVQGTKDLILQLAREALYAPNVPHLAIGHVRTDTIQGIEEVLPELEAMGVEVWPISRSLAHVVAADSVYPGASVTPSGDWSSTDDELLSKVLPRDYALVIDNPPTSPGNACTFTPHLQWEGWYRVYAGFAGDSSNSAEVEVWIDHWAGRTSLTLDQSSRPKAWHYLGRYPFQAGASGSVTLRDHLCTEPDRRVLADSFRFVLDASASLSHDVPAWRLY